MNTYFTVTISFVVLGVYVFALLWCWHRRLKSLALQFDVLERRRRASRQTILVLLLFVIPTLSVLLRGMIKMRGDGLFLVTCFLASLAPGAIWYARRIPDLRTLGYYDGWK